MSSGRHDDLDVFREALGKPEGDVGFFAAFVVHEAVDSLDDNHDLLVDLLRAVDNLLLLYLCADDVQPVREELPDVFLKQIDALFELEGFLELDDDLVEGVEVIAIVAAPACEVHYRQDLLFSAGVAQPHAFFPLAEDGLDAAARLAPEDQGPVVVFF